MRARKVKTPVATCRCYSISSPNAFTFLVSTVLGYFPEPHNLKEPKSLYQSPSGATGPDPTHSCNRPRSANEICRCCTRSKRCSQSAAHRKLTFLGDAAYLNRERAWNCDALADWLSATTAGQLVRPGHTHILPLVHQCGARTA